MLSLGTVKKVKRFLMAKGYAPDRFTEDHGDDAPAVTLLGKSDAPRPKKADETPTTSLDLTPMLVTPDGRRQLLLTSATGSAVLDTPAAATAMVSPVPEASNVTSLTLQQVAQRRSTHDALSLIHI